MRMPAMPRDIPPGTINQRYALAIVNRDNAKATPATHLHKLHAFFAFRPGFATSVPSGSAFVHFGQRSSRRTVSLPNSDTVTRDVPGPSLNSDEQPSQTIKYWTCRAIANLRSSGG